MNPPSPNNELWRTGPLSPMEERINSNRAAELFVVGLPPATGRATAIQARQALEEWTWLEEDRLTLGQRYAAVRNVRRASFEHI